MGKLDTALSNRPKERQAQRLANAEVRAKEMDNPDMTGEERKKLSQQALTKYRNVLGAKRTPVMVTDKEWEAIQAGAISENKLKQILDNTDKDNLREKATPRNKTSISPAQINRMKAMNASNYSIDEIAKALHLSASTVAKYLK